MFTITYDDGDVFVRETFHRPSRLPQPGDVYIVKQIVATLAGRMYRPGDRLEILGRTNSKPHHRLNSLGNLQVKCKFFTSIWTNIELMLEDGTIELQTEAVPA